MEAVVDDPLRDVFDLDPCRLLEGSRVDDAFVGHAAGGGGVQDVVVGSQPSGHVVGVEDRHHGGLHQPLPPHERDVRPGNGQDPGAAPRRGGHRAARLFLTQRHDRVVREERPEVGGDTDRPHPRPPAAVRDAKRLVEVQVAHIGAHVGRPAQPHLGVHVGAVHVHLAAVRVHDLAHLPDRPLENAGGRRVGHHQRGERALVFGRFGAEVRQIDDAARVGLDGHHREPGHHRARGIGAVGGGGN